MSELTPILSRPRLTAAQLGEIHAAFATRENVADELIRTLTLLDPPHVCRPLGLLRMIAKDRGLSPEHIAKILRHTDAFSEHWLSRLLACQLLAITGCPRENEDDTAPFLADCFRDRRVIVRAWALTVLSRFTGPHHRKTIAALFAAARKDPAKSMQARLRQLNAASKNPARQTHE
ncbi:hypothetical protein CMV30_16350 [Nibricoccus aquaticus]|uniref:HEAT repeat domain-containing protein n=1 Tax=Nibricoccus aquaticus TaxID=2576891 RepID=A0A290QJ80_9BACT|nr:hypothetical protein [Nibricoccus aquaticus]ATC65388.1 hypothetical protein CMV30_16350 [Nibricoccus aquaticus]